MQDSIKQVGIRDIGKGALQALKQAPAVNKGIFTLATVRPGSKQSIGKVLEKWARKKPHNIALRFEDNAWTYASFNAWANRIANEWKAQGVKPGDCVALLMENRPELLACVAATVKIGAIAGMLNSNQKGDVLNHSIGLVKPRILVVSAECIEALRTTDYTPENKSDIRFYWNATEDKTPAPDGFTDLDKTVISHSSHNPPETSEIVANTPCYYIFTSGTTGMPKASVMSHYRWLSSMAGLGGATLRMQDDDVFYCCLPMYHNNALTVSWSAVLSAGATLALDKKFSASRFWERIRHFDATAFCYIGELLRYLLNQQPGPGDKDHRIRLITGNGLRPEIWAEFEERFGIETIYEFYGASEANIAFINAFGVKQTAGFTPLPFKIVEFDADEEKPVRNAKGYMQAVQKGGVGLLISEISDRRPFDGYTDPAAGEKKLLRDVFKKGDCWFDSGDLVRDQGFRHIQFVDRVGDTFRWKGENVATTEIEGVLATIPYIEHGVVYGVSVPNADGRAGMVAMTLTPGTQLDGKALADALLAELPAYAVPLFIRMREQQETTGTFKYRKVELKNEGFDPGQVNEPLYVLVDKDKGYVQMTQQIFNSICDGEIRF